jgi:hypothetical protein
MADQNLADDDAALRAFLSLTGNGHQAQSSPVPVRDTESCSIEQAATSSGLSRGLRLYGRAKKLSARVRLFAGHNRGVGSYEWEIQREKHVVSARLLGSSCRGRYNGIDPSRVVVGFGASGASHAGAYVLVSGEP